MKKTILLAALMAATIPVLSGCGYASVDAGEEGVLIRKPWFVGHGGVDPETVKTGTELVAHSTEVINIPVTPLTFPINFEDIMPANGIPLDFQTTVRMQITAPAVLVEHWNGGHKDEHHELDHQWFWGNIAPQYSNLVRQAVRRYPMNELAMTGTAIDAVDREVFTQLSAFIAANHMPVRLLSITVGRAHPPQAILDQRTETAAQEQRQQTMVATQAAEVARLQAEQARANADNAYRVQMGLNPEQFVELKRIEMQTQACQHSTCIFGNGSALVQQH